MKKRFLFLGLTAIWCGLSTLSAQVTIGEDQLPQDFSVLELISADKGLRLPQLTTAHRVALESHLAGNPLAMGLTVFDIETRCVYTWNSVKWIEMCSEDGPFGLSPAPASACGITPDAGANTTYTAKADHYATNYEFFVSGVSQGKQSGNTITFASPVNAADITVQYYYHPAFLKPEMIAVTGSSSWNLGSGNTNTVETISDFYLSKTEVTQAQFEYVMETNPSWFRCGGPGETEGHLVARATSALPVEQISWYAAIAYCNKLSIMEGKTPCYSVSGVTDWAVLPFGSIPTSDDSDWNNAICDFSANGYRLPTESEWEYAARGGALTHDYPFAGGGANSTDAIALDTLGWFYGNNGSSGDISPPYYGTKDVAAKAPNELGLYDMSGNVCEWTWSGNYDAFPVATPTGGVTTTGYLRRQRSGSWNTSFSDCTVFSRMLSATPDYGLYASNQGFRVAATK
jgi:formylglycine-generating enzyme required for sulfatase activity